MNVAKVVTLTGCKICFYKDLSSVLLCACVIVLVLGGGGSTQKSKFEGNMKSFSLLCWQAVSKFRKLNQYRTTLQNLAT